MTCCHNTPCQSKTKNDCHTPDQYPACKNGIIPWRYGFPEKRVLIKLHFYPCVFFIHPLYIVFSLDRQLHIDVNLAPSPKKAKTEFLRAPTQNEIQDKLISIRFQEVDNV